MKNRKLILTGTLIVTVTLSLLAYFPWREYQVAHQEIIDLLPKAVGLALNQEVEEVKARQVAWFREAIRDSTLTSIGYFEEGELPQPGPGATVYYTDNEGGDFQYSLSKVRVVTLPIDPMRRFEANADSSRIWSFSRSRGERVFGSFPSIGFEVKDSIGNQITISLKEEIPSEVAYSDYVLKVLEGRYRMQLDLLEDGEELIASMVYMPESFPELDQNIFRASLQNGLDSLGLMVRADDKIIHGISQKGKGNSATRDHKGEHIAPQSGLVIERLYRHGNLDKVRVNFSGLTYATFWRMRNLLGVCVLVLLLMVTLFVLMYRNLRQQQALTQAREDFIDNMTHELQTPIATLLAIHEGFEKYQVLDNPERTQRYLTTVGQQVRRLSRLSDAVVGALQRSETLAYERDVVALDGFLREVSAEYTGRDDLALMVGDIPTQAKAWADPQLLRQVMDTVLDNAIKYRTEERASVTILMAGVASGWQIRVADEGPGIAKEHRERIFEKFYRIDATADHSVKGYGIGLYYAREAVLRMEGSLTVEAVQPHGACFVINLPKANEEA